MAKRELNPGSGQKQNTFFGGAAILAVGILVVKLIGMFYKIPLVNIIGEEGTADFNNAYNIYAVLLTISTAGLPVAVSKLVSEANATGRRNASTVFIMGVSGAILYLVYGVGARDLGERLEIRARRRKRLQAMKLRLSPHKAKAEPHPRT